MSEDYSDLMLRQTKLIDSLMDKVTVLEFAVMALSRSHPDEKLLQKEVEFLGGLLRDPPDEYWDDVAKRVEQLTGIRKVGANDNE